LASVPADDVAGDLVADGEAEDGGVVGEGADGAADVDGDAVAAVGVVVEGDVLFPGESAEDAEVVACGGVEEPAGWGCVGAEGVDAVGVHGGEVVFDDVGFGEEFVRGVAGEGAVGDAAEVELLVATPQELAGDRRGP
jgi:hypothetical protein